MGMFDDLIPEASKAPGGGGMFDDLIPPPSSTAGDVAKSFGIGIPKGVMGLASLPGEASNLIGRGVNAAGNWLTGRNQSFEDYQAKRAAALGGADIAAPTGETVRKGVESVTGPLYEPKTTAGEYAQTVGEFLPAAIAGPGGVVRRAVTGAVIPGVTSEAAGQATKGTAAEPYARMAGAVVPGAIAAGAKGMVVSPKGGATRAAEVANLEAEGVRDLSAGAKTGSTPLQYLEQSLGDVTGAGTRKAERAQEQFTRAVLKRAGEDAPRATPEVIDRAFKRIGDKFDDLAANNTLHPDRAMGPQIRQSIDDYNGIVSPPNRAPVIANFEQEIAQVLGANNNAIPGVAYQSLRSRMEKVARTAPPEVADTVRGMKNALDQAMERHLQRTNSPDLGAWQQARREYRNILPIERAATAAGSDAATGLISPSSLRNAVVSQGRRGYARGTGDLARLARSGEAVMKQLPQSGTAPRAYMMSLPASVGAIAGGMASGNPLLTAGGVLGALGPPVGGRALMSRPVQNWLARQGPRNFTPAVGGAASLLDMQ